MKTREIERVHVIARNAGILLPLLLAAIALGLSGCGYHLRGQQSASGGTGLNEPVYVRAPAELDGALAVALGAAGSSMVNDAKDAQLELAVLDQSFERRLLSVDPESGREREFELLYVVHFTANRGGEALLPERQVKVLRDIVINTEAIVAKQREEELIESEMRAAAADRIVRMLGLAASG